MELDLIQSTYLSHFDGNAIQVSVQELESGINGLVDSATYPSEVKLQSCIEQFGWIDKRFLPDIWSTYLAELGCSTLCQSSSSIKVMNNHSTAVILEMLDLQCIIVFPLAHITFTWSHITCHFGTCQEMRETLMTVEKV